MNMIRTLARLRPHVGLRLAVLLVALGAMALASAQGGALAGGGGGGGSAATTASVPGVSIESKLGDTIPLDVPLKNDRGETIATGSLLRGRPVVLLPIFYRCTGVCTIEMQGVIAALARNPKLRPGRDFDIVALGLNPKETPELAAAKKAEYVEQDGRKEAASAWTLLTGPQAETQRFAKAVGFNYTYDPVKDRVNHPSAVVVLTPKGRVSTVMTQGMYPSAQFAFDVKRASEEKIDENVETSWMGCLAMDPVTGKKSIVVMGVARLLAIVVIVAILVSMAVLSRRKAKNPSPPLDIPW